MSKLYLELRPAPRLYLDLPDESIKKSEEVVEVYLEVEKSNPFREPVKGQFMAGGTAKAKGKDLSETLEELLGGEELKKED